MSSIKAFECLTGHISGLYFETSNNYDGVTVYIAEEVNQNA